MSGVKLQPGDRIWSAEEIGTIRYVGPVENSKGEYLGVEWDNLARGKHDGTHNGKQYFQTRNGQTSGSFIKEKLLDPMRTCIQAVHEKYGRIDDETAGVEEEDMYLNQGYGRVLHVEVIGMRKINDLQCEFDRLAIVNLTNMGITSEPDPRSLADMLKSVTELDLSANLINSWSAVSNIIKYLNKLQSLDLRGNRLAFDIENLEESKKSFSSIKKLNLALCNLDWKQIEECSLLWPDVEELHLPMNHITEIKALPTGSLTCLRVLNLEGNTLCDWTNLKPFSQLTRLNTLLINNCGLKNIQISDGEFQSLKLLVISKNLINEWTCITELYKCKGLRELVFDHNPILNVDTVDTNRQIVIANLPQLKIYNRTAILDKERREAEFDYLKRYGQEWIDLGASTEETDQNKLFYIQHPVYQSLIKKWGAPESGEVKQKDVFNALKKSLIAVIITDNENKVRVEKKIPVTMIILKLRILSQKLLKSKKKGDITYRARENGQIFEFDHDMRELDYYAVSDGDEIIFTPGR